jgi:hypothetical protein
MGFDEEGGEMKYVRLWAATGAVLTAGALLGATAPAAGARAKPAAPRLTASSHVSVNCATSKICPDVAESDDVFGNYVGHDEPSAVFYSNKPGSGNRMQYSVRLPGDPSPKHPNTKSYQQELNATFWFGLALCDTQSYPEQVSTCKPDSDSNIVDPAVSPKHPGTAFMELQFYPPGWVPWPTWAVAAGAGACDPTKWCAAMNIFGLSENPVTGQLQNSTCAAKAGIEYFNFAFITKNGRSQGPANPLQSTLATFTPNPAKDLLMNSGDVLNVSVHDTGAGVQAVLNDKTSHRSGSMTASAANGFAQVKFAPTGTSCTAIPHNFHPMYSTSSPQTRVIWAAHTYNVAFSDEIGHFQFCNGAAVPATPFGLDSNGNPITCPAGNTEGSGANQRPTDGDDDFCFPASEALLYKVQGCTETNQGFDGIPYTPVWPDGNTKLHPTPFQFTSALTGANFDQTYSRVAFEADLPAVESNTCNRNTGAGCTLIPTTDTGQPAQFYPFFTTTDVRGTCNWQFGNDTPGETNNFGHNAQYGSLLPLTYLRFGGGGSTVTRFNDFRGVIPNPC